MKILFLVESFNINHHSSAIGRSKFIISFLHTDNDVTVLYPDESVPGLKNIDPIWLDNAKLVRFPLSKITSKEKFINLFPKVRALPTYLKGYHLSFQRLIGDWKKNINNELNKEDYDLIVVLGTGMSFAPHFAMADIDTTVPWIANIHDPFPIQFYPSPYGKKENFMYRNLAKRFNKVLEKATWTSFPSLRLKEWMEQFYPVISDKSFIVPHLEVNQKIIDMLPINENDKKVQLNLKKLNLLHAGSLLGPRNPTFLIKAFLRFIEEEPERKEQVVLNIIGKVAREHQGFENQYKIFKNNINIVTDRVSYKYSLSLLKKADVLILLEAISDVSPFMPGKLADYIWASKPILALTPKNSETSRILGKDYPYITQTDNEEEIYNLLVVLWEKWKSNSLKAYNNELLKSYISSEENYKKIMEYI